MTQELRPGRIEVRDDKLPAPTPMPGGEMKGPPRRNKVSGGGGGDGIPREPNRPFEPDDPDRLQAIQARMTDIIDQLSRGMTVPGLDQELRELAAQREKLEGWTIPKK